MDESPWDEEATAESVREAEWSKISTEFTTIGYREGITAGKESALQEGFDSGFAHVGAPIGRELGILRGMISAMLASGMGDVDEARSIASQLSRIRFSDIAPRDLEAEAHAKEHLEMEGEEMELGNDDLMQKREMEGLEDMLTRLTASAPIDQPKLTMEDVQAAKEQILSLCNTMGLDVNWS